MTSQNITEQEQRAIVAICILSAFADGGQNEAERVELKRIVDNFANPNFDLTTAYQEALSGKAALSEIARTLQSANAKALAYEMAVCICNADHTLSPAEDQFLAGLRQALNLDPAAAATVQQSATTLRNEPLREPPVIANLSRDQSDLDDLILNRSILAGALELMPHTMATMGIVPVQMRLVYQIGKRYGYDLDLSHAKEFLATIGVGLTSQMFEGFVGRLMHGLGRHVVGGLLGGLATQAAESAVAFGTTYAIGQVAKRYYESGRTLSTAQLREVFASMLNQGRSMQSQYGGQIRQQAGSLNVANLLPLVQRS
jgi:uncharacterized protein (DUF697 family)/tellurite resistance protein